MRPVTTYIEEVLQRKQAARRVGEPGYCGAEHHHFRNFLIYEKNREGFQAMKASEGRKNHCSVDLRSESLNQGMRPLEFFS